MLDLMRKHAKSWVINILIAAIVIVFIFWGAGTFRERTTTKVATVNGHVIPLSAYQDAYQKLLDAARQQFGQYLNDELLSMLNLKQQALSRLVDQQLLHGQAQVLEVGVRKADLQTDIAATPAFQVDGQFSAQRYREMLGRYGYSPSQWESMRSMDLTNQRVADMIGSNAKVSPVELKQFFHLLRDQVTVSYVFFAPEKYFDQVSASEEEVKAWFEKNTEHYRIPAKFKAAYVLIKSKDLESQITFDDAYLREEYDIRANDFQQPEQVRLREILIPLAEGASDEDKAAAKASAEAVLAEIVAGGPDTFAEMARLHSTASSAADGGELGFVERGDLGSEAVASAAFSLEPGAISGVIETPEGFYILKAEEKKEAGRKPFEEVKDQIISELAVKEAQVKAQDLAETVADEAGLSRDLSVTAGQHDLTLKTTDFLSVDQALEDVGGDLRFNQAAASLKKGELSPLLELKDGYCVLQVVDTQDSRLPELNEVQERVRTDVLNDKATALAKKTADEFAEKAAGEGDFDAMASEAGLEIKSTDPFTRQGPAGEIGSNREVIEAAFGLVKPGKVDKTPVAGSGGFYVIRLKENLPAQDDAFEAEKDQFLVNLRRGKAQNLAQLWLLAIKSKAEVKVEPGII